MRQDLDEDAVWQISEGRHSDGGAVFVCVCVMRSNAVREMMCVGGAERKKRGKV